MLFQLVWLLLFSPDPPVKSPCLAARLWSKGVFEFSKEVIMVFSIKACNSLNNHISLPSMFALNDLWKVSGQGYMCNSRGGDVLHLDLTTSLLAEITIRKYPVLHFPLHRTCVCTEKHPWHWLAWRCCAVSLGWRETSWYLTSCETWHMLRQ